MLAASAWGRGSQEKAYATPGQTLSPFPASALLVRGDADDTAPAALALVLQHRMLLESIPSQCYMLGMHSRAVSNNQGPFFCPFADVYPAGLSAWDKHVGYRNLRMHPALAQLPPSPALKQHHIEGLSANQQPQQGLPGPAPLAQHGKALPSLLECCQAALLQSFSPLGVCDLLQVADCLSPVADGLRRWVWQVCQAAVSLLSMLAGSLTRWGCAIIRAL
jgi:hypothetical protein